MQNNPSIFPASFRTADFQRDVELFAALTEINTMAESVTAQIDDTRLAVGGEAMQAASQGYQYIQAAARMTPGLRPLKDSRMTLYHSIESP
jgi:hypothetical protein